MDAADKPVALRIAQSERPGAGCGSGRQCVKRPVDPHTCPYSEEINDDHTSTCTCCADCEQECRDDI